MSVGELGAGLLAGRSAVVTSSSRNLGAEIARTMAAHGARVAVTYHGSAELAKSLVREMNEASALQHVAVQGDLTDPDGVTQVMSQALERLGQIDILVNNFGPFSTVPLHELPYETWQSVWAGNLTSAHLASQLVIPGMRSSGWGRIINLSAGSAYLRNHSVYGLVKQAVITLTESLALELGPEITVNALAPGQIEESSEDVKAVDPTFVDRALARTPAGRLTTRREVAQVAALICSAPFDMLTGAVLPLDGGWRFNRF